MSKSGGPWQRVQRLDPGWAVAAVRAEAGVELVGEGPCAGGQVGAAYVRWADGHRAVLTWRPGWALADVRARQLATAEALRVLGYPAPGIELAVEVPVAPRGRAVVLVQELLPGVPVEHLGPDLLDQALALDDLQAGALAEHPQVSGARLHLREDGPGFCLHEPLRRHSRRSAPLEAWVRGVGTSLPGDVLTGDDAVHVDFQPTNLLADAGRITGVVDWDGAGRGDRRLDLVTLRFGVARPRRPRRRPAPRRPPRRDPRAGAHPGVGAHEPAHGRLGHPALRARPRRALAGPRRAAHPLTHPDGPSRDPARAAAPPR